MTKFHTFVWYSRLRGRVGGGIIFRMPAGVNAYRDMKEIMMLIGVFALGYVLTMGLLFALLKVFFPLQRSEKDALDNQVEIVKLPRANRVNSRLRKVRLA